MGVGNFKKPRRRFEASERRARDATVQLKLDRKLKQEHGQDVDQDVDVDLSLDSSQDLSQDLSQESGGQHHSQDPSANADPATESQPISLSEFDKVLGTSYATCGRIALEMGLHQSAVANFARALEKSPHDAGLLVDFAKALGAESNQEKIVVSTLIDALQHSQDFSDHRIWAQLAQSYFILQKPEDAFQSVSRAIAAQEVRVVKDPDLWVLQSRILLLWMDSDGKMGLDTLTPYFQGAVKMAINSKDVRNELQARVSLAQLYHRFACYSKSQAEVAHALTLVQNNPMFELPKPAAVNTLCYLYNFMCIIQFKLNQKTNAYGLLHEAMSILPQVSGTARLLATRAQFHMIDGDLTSLKTLLPALLIEKNALSEHDRNRLYVFNWLLGRIFDMLDDTKQSYDFYQCAVNSKPQSASLWIGIGSLYLRMRQFEDAHIAFSHALNNASKLENFEHPFLLRFNRLFAAFAWVGLSQVFVATYRKQNALDALRQASVLFTSEGDVIHASQVDQIFNDVLASTNQNPIYIIMNVPPQILLELFLYYDAGIFSSNLRPPEVSKMPSCEPATQMMPAMVQHPPIASALAYSPLPLAPNHLPSRVFQELNQRYMTPPNTYFASQPHLSPHKFDLIAPVNNHNTTVARDYKFRNTSLQKRSVS
ncbi:LANO_0F13124g1_1 [Lachancea nothofagi CBS 11611]|uniref:LANO_0F13124g1_1 n=1 Tax=Lachancea nothofagi CBS 11611 TaxID=1266666 RepID=A0A1G4KBN7_9SACH|nr:LANO_0F13124g1_1 [Lachancea nothofagi CBS 11611]